MEARILLQTTFLSTWLRWLRCQTVKALISCKALRTSQSTALLRYNPFQLLYSRYRVPGPKNTMCFHCCHSCMCLCLRLRPFQGPLTESRWAISVFPITHQACEADRAPKPQVKSLLHCSSRALMLALTGSVGQQEVHPLSKSRIDS